MRIFFLLIIFFIASSSTFAQNERPTDIKEIKLNDTALINIIEKFSDEKSVTDSLYKAGKGYLILSVSPHVNQTLKGVQNVYNLNVNYVNFDGDDEDRRFPLFYTFTSKGRPVLLFVPGLFRLFELKISQTSREIFRAKLEPFLPPKIDMPDFKDATKTIKGRAEYWMQIHGGIYLFKMADNSYTTRTEF